MRLSWRAHRLEPKFFPTDQTLASVSMDTTRMEALVGRTTVNGATASAGSCRRSIPRSCGSRAPRSGRCLDDAHGAGVVGDDSPNAVRRPLPPRERDRRDAVLLGVTDEPAPRGPTPAAVVVGLPRVDGPNAPVSAACGEGGPTFDFESRELAREPGCDLTRGGDRGARGASAPRARPPARRCAAPLGRRS